MKSDFRNAKKGVHVAQGGDSLDLDSAERPHAGHRGFWILTHGRRLCTSGFWILDAGRAPGCTGFWILIKIFFGARCARPAPDPYGVFSKPPDPPFW